MVKSPQAQKPQQNLQTEVEKEDAPLIHYLKNQVKARFSPIIAVVGRTGIGKSMCALQVALSLTSSKFNIQRNTAFDVRDMLKIMEDTYNDILILDEAGTNLSSKEYYSLYNRAFSKILQTQRFRTNIYLLVLPHVQFLAKDHRIMLDAIVHVKRRGYARWWVLRQKHWVIEGEPVKTFYMGPFWYKLPPLELRKQYHTKEAPQKAEILERIRADLDMQEKKRQTRYENYQYA